MRLPDRRPLAADEFYLNARREETQAGMPELLSQLDGSRAAPATTLPQ